MTQTTNSEVVIQSKDHILSNSFYDVLKWVVTLLLPGLGTLYYAIAGIWGLAYAEQVVGTIAAVTVFLGVVMKLGDLSYSKSQTKYDGSMNVAETDDKKTYTLDLNVSPEELDQKNQIVFKVNKS